MLTLGKLILSKLSLKDKMFLGIITILLIIISYYAVNKAYTNYVDLKKELKDMKAKQVELEAHNKKIDSTLTFGKTTTTRAIQTKKAIDKKLEDDKKNIDNSIYPISKIDSILSSYGN